MFGEKLKYRRQLQGAVEARELLEIAEALHDEGFTEQQVKFFRKPLAEIAFNTVAQPGQARLVEKQLGIIVALPELEEIIERTRQELDHPLRKKRLKVLLSLKDELEPCKNEIGPGRGAEGLKLHAAALRRLRETGQVRAGENCRPGRMRI